MKRSRRDVVAVVVHGGANVRSRNLLLCMLAVALTASPVRAEGPGLETLELGSGPTVVMVPGIGGTRTDWLQTVKRLRDRYHCVMVEIPGQGKSPLPEPFSLQAAAQALDAVIAKQKPESTIVVANGVGGTLALLAASAHPEHLRGLMLIDAPLKSPVPVTDQQREQLKRIMDENYDQFSQMAFSRMGRDSTESALLFALMAAVPPATVKSYFRELVSADANRELKELKVPLALAFTERSWKAGNSAGTVMRSFGMEDSTLAVPLRIANAGRLPMKDQPDTLAAWISGFAARNFAGKKK
jgi:pimeloyl-ACP methyl ester carboxylesterase